MEAIIEFVRNKKCNFCSSQDDTIRDEKPFLVQVNFLRICKDCIDKLWRLSEGIDDD